MRIAHVDIHGTSYPAAFSLRVLADLEDRTGKPASQALDTVLASSSVKDTVWLLAALLSAGARAEGAELRTPTEAELLDSISLDELHGLTAGVLASVRELEPTLPVEPKNAEAM